MPPEAESATGGVPCSTSEWLESPLLARIAKRVACQYGILPGEVDDLVQEVRIALWEAEGQLEIKPRWVFVTASHKAVDLLRRRRRVGAELAQARATTRPAEELNCLDRARVAQLPKNLQVFCDLRYGEGLTEREIAGRMGLCRASVRWLGLRFLRAVRAPYFFSALAQGSRENRSLAR